MAAGGAGTEAEIELEHQHDQGMDPVGQQESSEAGDRSDGE